MSKALFLLLDNQFIVSATLHTTYKCVKGSGIGLSISAIVASLYFYSRVESRLIDSSVGLLKWVRYHDDVIAIFRNRHALRAFFPALKNLAQPTYVVVCESVHSVGQEPCSFLDLEIVVQVPSLYIQASQHKPITPLCPTSAHQPAIHKSWPKSVAYRVHTLSGVNPQAVSTLIDRYKHAGSHRSTIKVLRSWQSVSGSRLEPMQKLKLPFVLRYHPLFKFAFNKAIKLVPPPVDFNLHVFAGWKNALPSLSGMAQSAALRSLKRDLGSREGFCFSFRLPNLQQNTLREFNMNRVLSLM